MASLLKSRRTKRMRKYRTCTVCSKGLMHIARRNTRMNSRSARRVWACTNSACRAERLF